MIRFIVPPRTQERSSSDAAANGEHFLSQRTSLGTLMSGGTLLATHGVLSSVGEWGEATVRARGSGLSTSRGAAEDLRLVSRIASGDEAALRQLYDHYGTLVHSVAMRVTQDPCAAEDVAQQVFIRVWERPTRFDPERGSLRAWLATLSHSRAVDHVRREQACHRREQRQLTEAPSAVDEAATSSAVAERVRRAVDALPDDQRTAVLLAYYDAQTYRQVAATLDIPEGTAKSRLRLGLRRIAKCLEQEGLGVRT